MTDIAQALLDALDERRQIAPPSDDDGSFGLDAAYRVSQAIMAARIARGEQPVGWKIGFTNRLIWDEYGVRAPIWGPIYRGSVIACEPERDMPVLDASAFAEPRIEPEVVLRIARPPRAGMDDEALLACIDAVGHGFEIVQSIYPGWRFTAPDTVAACALHGALVHGPLTPVDHGRTRAWLDMLASFEVILFWNGMKVDRGEAKNVLGGPLAALRHFLAELEERPIGRGVEAGDLVITGTLTRAFPVEAGEVWSTQLDGLPSPDMRLRFTGGEQDTPARWIERAAQARFRFENPNACESAADYEHAVSASVEAETALSRMFLHDGEGLAEARRAVESRALALARAWKDRTDP